MTKISVPTEFEEQKGVVAFLEGLRLKFTAIPNSTFTPSWSQKAKNHASGLRSGLPDLLIILPGRTTLEGHVPSRLMFVEMKRRDASPSDVKPEQRAWIEALNHVPGVVAVVCKGQDEARKAIEAEIKKG